MKERADVDLSGLWFKYRAYHEPAEDRGGLEPDRNSQLLLESKLFFAAPDSLNDPFECLPRFEFSKNGVATPKQIRHMVDRYRPDLSWTKRRDLAQTLERKSSMPESLAIFRPNLELALRQQFRNVAVCCFSDNADNSLQWAHYANGHTGFALGFDFSVPWPAVVPSPNGQVRLNLHPQRVNYSHEYPTIDLDSPMDTLPEVRRIAETALLTKGLAWKYEGEGRIVLPDEPPGLRNFPPRMLKAVILGSKMRPKHRETVIQLARSRNHPPAILQAIAGIGSYQLELKAIA